MQVSAHWLSVGPRACELSSTAACEKAHSHSLIASSSCVQRRRNEGHFKWGSYKLYHFRNPAIGKSGNRETQTSGMQKSRNREIPKSRNPESQKSRNAEFVKSRNREIQKSRKSGNPEIRKGSLLKEVSLWQPP